jgi:hypothetical protein
MIDSKSISFCVMHRKEGRLGKKIVNVVHVAHILCISTHALRDAAIQSRPVRIILQPSLRRLSVSAWLAVVMPHGML